MIKHIIPVLKAQAPETISTDIELIGETDWTRLFALSYEYRTMIACCMFHVAPRFL